MTVKGVRALIYSAKPNGASSARFRSIQSAKKREDFYETHRADITLHKAAKNHFDSLGLKKFPPMAELGEAFQIKESAALKAKDKALEKLRRVCLDGGLCYWMSVRAAIREAQRECFVARGDLGRYTNPEGCDFCKTL